MAASVGLWEENDGCTISVEEGSCGGVQQITVKCFGWSTKSGDSSEG